MQQRFAAPVRAESTEKETTVTDEIGTDPDDAVRSLDAALDEQYESPLLDAAGNRIDADALAVDASDATLDDSVVELTLGQEDDVLPDGQADPR